MIRTGEEYRESIRDGREVWIDGERVDDVTTHPAFKPIVDVRARIYDLAHEAGDARRDVATSTPRPASAARSGRKLPLTQGGLARQARARSTPCSTTSAGSSRASATRPSARCGRCTTARTCSNEIDPAFSEHIRHHVRHAALADPFHVSANTDPKGDRSRRPQDQDPDVLLHVVGETDNGIIVRGAKFETAAAYANQAFVKPTIGDWGDAELSDYAVGFVADMGAPGITHICRSSFAGRGRAEDYPLSNGFDEIDTMIVFDDVEIPWENVFFYRHTRAAAFIRATLHRYSMFPFVQRHLRFADLLVGDRVHERRADRA